MVNSLQSAQENLVSVIMPVLNAARFLADALASVAAQTYAPMEVLIIDGPSTDATAQLAQAFSGVRYWQQRGKGLWNAVNEGIAAARGEYIAILSADDLWLPTKTAVQVAYLHGHPNVQLLGSHVRFQLLEGETPPPGFKEHLLTGIHATTMPEALLVRRSLFAAIGGFDEQRLISADVDWLGRVQAHGISYAMLPDLLLVKRIHARNMTTDPQYAAHYRRELVDVLRGTVQLKRSPSLR